MKLLRVGICALIAFAVLTFGAVQAWSQAVLEISAVALLLAWVFFELRRGEFEIHWQWIYMPLLGLGALGLAQYFFKLSANPFATKAELLRWTCYFLLGFLAIESFRTVEQRKGFAWFMICFCFLISLFALVQHFTSNGKLYWVIALPEGSLPIGPFVNRNHFAGFVEVADPLGLALLFSGSHRSEKTILLGFFALLPVGALVASASRGGAISFLGETIFLAWLLRKEIAARGRIATLSFAVLAVVLAIWLGLGITVERFESLESEHLSRDVRMMMYKSTWRIVEAHPVIGTGAGTLETVYPHFESKYQENLVDHVHNDYLELLAETGAAGGALVLSFIALLFYSGTKELRAAKNSLEKSLAAGALAGCTGLLIHSFVDFNLHIPSNALLFLLLAGMAVARPDQGRVFSRAGAESGGTTSW